jgi:hypothetical protein
MEGIISKRKEAGSSETTVFNLPNNIEKTLCHKKPG